MDFTPSESQQALAALTREIVTDRVSVEVLRAAEQAGERYDRKLWSALAEAGVLGAEVGLLEQCSVLVELGRALAPVPYLSTVAVAGAALGRFGSADQQEQWLTPALTGQVVLSVALSSDYAVPVHAAGKSEGGWVLDGEVNAVTAAPVADAFLVSTDAGVFIVLPGDPGVTVERQQMTDHDDAGLLSLANVALGPDRLLATAGGAGAGSAGAGVAGWLRDRATVALSAYQLGVLQRGLELTAEYARTRVQFGRPIGAFQAVSQRLANAYVDVQAVELALWEAAYALDAGEDTTDPVATAGSVATAKFWASEAGHRVAHTVVHVHGGAGIDLDQPVHRYFLAAKRGEFELGSATAQLRRLGSLLATR